MKKRRTILFLSQSLPYPPHSGVTNRTFNIVRQLQRSFDVTLLPFSRSNHQANGQERIRSREALAQHVTEVLDPVPIPSESSTLARALVHLKSVIARRPYVYYEYRQGKFRDQLLSWLGNHQPSLIHLDSLDLYGWVPDLSDAPTACTHHSIESELLRLRAEHIDKPPLAAYMRYQAKQLEQIERVMCPRFDVNVMMSDIDARRLEELAPGSRTYVAPNGVDTESFVPDPTAPAVPGRVVFLGPTYMYPNRDAIEFFMEQCWERVRQLHPTATLTLVGRIKDEDRRRYESLPGVVCEGYVSDIRPHLAAASCCIAPLRIGGGTRLKILDYWAMGRPVVSTSIGCEGLEVEDGVNILVRDNPDVFADAVVDVLAHPALQGLLAQGGRQTAEDVYSWGSIGQGLRDAYLKLTA